MKHAIISLGSNLGNRKENIELAYRLIEMSCGNIIKRSSFYETPPWGFDSTSSFYNSIIEIKTALQPLELLTKLKSIEVSMGRVYIDPSKYTDRIIDIDIIDLHGEVLKTEQLELPHPRLDDRDFVLYPLAEILPNWIHPGNNKSINSLLNNLPNERFIEKIN